MLPEIGGSCLFKLYDKQEEYLHCIHQHKYVATLKTRQVGASTVIQAYIVWLMVFYDNVIVGVISKDGPECTDFARKVMDMIDELPKWLQPVYDKHTEQSFILSNGSKLYTSTVNPSKPSSVLRGKSIAFLVIDEASHISYIDEAYTGMTPALFKTHSTAKRKGVPYGTVVISTPNGVQGDGKWYFERIKEARSSKSIFKYFEIHWKQIKEFANDPDWYKIQCELLHNDERKIAQELNMVFLGSKDSVFADSTLERIQNAVQEPIDKIHLLGGELWVYEYMNSTTRYVIGVDTATKQGRCHSTIQIINFETLEQVAEYQGDIEVIDFEKLVRLIMDKYPNNLCVIEVNSYGGPVVATLQRNFKYSQRLFKRTIKDRRGKVIDYKYGLETTGKTRPLMMEALLTYVTDYPYIVKSKRLMDELIGLEEKNGKVKGSNTDDLALALAFCLYAIKYKLTAFIDLKYDESEIDSMKNIISAHNDNETEYQSYNKLVKELSSTTDKQDYNKLVKDLNKINKSYTNIAMPY